jgi:CheY-like chemotaxis protein/anti-sigma regulatory factor (Ser/Thr protein kinase)
MVDLRDVIRDVLLVSQPSAQQKGIRVAFDADGAIGKVHGDPTRLQQVVSNLISNALKFTPPNGAVHIRLRRSGQDAELVVTDTGQGISPEFLPSVFEVFRQADGSTTRMHSGLGLGLSIVKSLVEAHNGTVTVHSAGHDRGATFIVRLPIAVFDDASDKAPERAPAQEPARHEIPSLAGVTVLMVDDDEESRAVVAAHLKQYGAGVVTAASAAEAFDLLQRGDVGVLLADIGMPDEDGYSLIRRVRALTSPKVATIPAAALTAFARDEDRLQALNAGFQLHLPKPVDAASLVNAVATLGRMQGSAAARASDLH